MALVFNGSANTIAGLAVGGLPDGSVDSDTLASSVTTGKILQVASGTTSTEVEVSSTSFTDTGLSATITPSSGTKILIMTSQCFYLERDYRVCDIYWQLMRDSTAIDLPSNSEANNRSYAHGVDSIKIADRMAYTYLDTHGADGSTAVTYKTQVRVDVTSDDHKCKFQKGDIVAAHMYLMEVAA